LVNVGAGVDKILLYGNVRGCDHAKCYTFNTKIRQETLVKNQA
jgi:hypothetical protein